MKQQIAITQGENHHIPARSLARLRREMPGHSEEHYQTIAMMVDTIANYLTHPETPAKAVSFYRGAIHEHLTAIWRAQRKAVRNG